MSYFNLDCSNKPLGGVVSERSQVSFRPKCYYRNPGTLFFTHVVHQGGIAQEQELS